MKDTQYQQRSRKITNHHDHNIRKWIRQIQMEQGIDGIVSKKHNHKQHKFTDEIEKKIVDIASANPKYLWFGIFHMVITWASHG